MAQGIKTGGRVKGTPNKITTAFKDAVRIVYSDIGGDAAFAEWATENRGEFYKIAARLIPTEIATRGDNTITVIVNRDGARPDVVGERSSLPTLPAQVVEH